MQLPELGPQFAEMIVGLWDALKQRTPPSELERVKGFLEVLRGEGAHLIQPDHQQVPAVPFFFFPGLKSSPFIDSKAVPWVPALEAAWPSIREEYVSLRDGDIIDYESPYYLVGEVDEQERATGWKSFYLHSSFRPVGKNLARCPATARALSQVPIAKEALFSILEPGAHIPEHSDEFNFVVTCHLGVVVPEGCSIRVGGETRAWKEGQCLLLDTSYLHEAWNPSKQRRAVLLIDAWHPDLRPAEVDALQFIRPQLEAAFGAVPRAESTES